MNERMELMRTIISEVLEVEPEEMTESSRFVEDHGADSLRAIEILARLEKKFSVRIPQNDLNKMTNLTNVYQVVQGYANWAD